MIDREHAEAFMAVIQKHSETVSLDLLFDLALALGLTVKVTVIDNEKEQGTK